VIADAFRWGTFVDAFDFIGDHPVFLLQKAAEQLELAGAALGVAMLVALPIGVALGHLHRGSFLAVSAGNLGRALPSLVLIGIFLTVLGIGFLNNLVALVVLAVAPLLTNAYAAVDGVEPAVVEAARGVGLTEAQILRGVELPLALPLLFSGIRIAAVTVVATAPIAAIAGGGGLGDVIVNQASYRLEGVLGASICVIALAFAVFLALVAVQRAVTPRGIRGR
jgi:osmoprotectant transport system permease protein